MNLTVLGLEQESHVRWYQISGIKSVLKCFAFCKTLEAQLGMGKHSVGFRTCNRACSLTSPASLLFLSRLVYILSLTFAWISRIFRWIDILIISELIKFLTLWKLRVQKSNRCHVLSNMYWAHTIFRALCSGLRTQRQVRYSLGPKTLTDWGYRQGCQVGTRSDMVDGKGRLGEAVEGHPYLLQGCGEVQSGSHVSTGRLKINVSPSLLCRITRPSSHQIWDFTRSCRIISCCFSFFKRIFTNHVV